MSDNAIPRGGKTTINISEVQPLTNNGVFQIAPYDITSTDNTFAFKFDEATDSITLQTTDYSAGTTGARFYIDGSNDNVSLETQGTLAIDAVGNIKQASDAQVWLGANAAPLSDPLANIPQLFLGLNAEYSRLSHVSDIYLDANYDTSQGCRVHLDESTRDVAVDANTISLSGSATDVLMKINCGFRPGTNYLVGGTLRSEIFVDGGGFATGYNNGLIMRAGTGGVALAQGATSFAALSDIRKKDSINKLTSGLDTVSQIQPISFFYKDDTPEYRRSNPKRVGFSAQELQQVFPESVSGDKVLGVRAVELIPVLVNAINELRQRVEVLEA